MLTTQHYTIDIHAPREKVWELMLKKETYQEWTAAFMPGGYYEGSWEKGSPIRFLGKDPETGLLSGMISEIADNRLHEYVSIRHIGFIEQGVEDTTSEKIKAWAPSYENYTLSDDGDGTKVDIEVQVVPEYAGYMAEAWPKALALLKALCEK